MEQKTYIAIDLKSFYASCECASLGYDPLDANLVVADESRTEKTICLAVSPSLKKYGIAGRARLFEVVQRVEEINNDRLAFLQKNFGQRDFSGSSFYAHELESDPTLKLSYIAAPPRMSEYMRVSTEIVKIYCRYISPEDMHVYSVDEVFMDVTAYLRNYGMTARELAEKMIHDVLRETGITATAGIGTNLFLCKVAMDIVAKHIPPDEYGVRIAELNERSFREKLWDHTPLTDFWRIGRGYSAKLHKYGMFTMGDIARCSLGSESSAFNEDLLYKLFGKNAELLIDHAWGLEPCTMADIHSYRPSANSLSSGQVLSRPYEYEEAEIIVREMTEEMVLKLVEKHLKTNRIVLTIFYDVENLSDPERMLSYKGEVSIDWYGRAVPKHARGTANLGGYSSSTREIMEAVLSLFESITDHSLLVRRLNISAEDVKNETLIPKTEPDGQMDLFTDYEAEEKKREEREASLDKERRMQQAIIDIRRRFGKNALTKGTSYEEAATGRERNSQIGGHKA